MGLNLYHLLQEDDQFFHAQPLLIDRDVHKYRSFSSQRVITWPRSVSDHLHPDPLTFLPRLRSDVTRSNVTLTYIEAL